MKNGSFDDIYSEIKGYVNSSNATGLPLFINTDNRLEYLHIKEKLSEFLNVWRVSTYCRKPDECPDLGMLFSELRNTTDNILLVGFSHNFKLLDRDEQKRYLGIIKELLLQNGKLVVLCFHFKEQLMNLIKFDRRIGNRMVFLKGDSDPKPSVTFLNPDIELSNIEGLKNGYQEYLYSLEDNCIEDAIVKSLLFHNDYSNALITVSRIETYFQIINLIDESIRGLLREYLGNEEQWKYLYNLIVEHKTFQKAIKAVFGTSTNFRTLFPKWNNMSSSNQWLLFLCIKMYESSNSYLSEAVAASNSVDEFVKNLYRNILDYKYYSEVFDDYYVERKELISYINSLDNICSFCQIAKIAGADEIHYLTDLSDYEKQEIISCLSRIDLVDNNTILVINKIYPELGKYLREFYFDNPMLDEYFQAYKLQKVNNKIQPSFLDLVNMHAEKREYNLLPSRNDIFERANKDDAVIFFIDALGVEFLGYISALCKELHLKMKVSICRANLPTTTFYNKDFLDGFSNYPNIKELDELKHDGKGDFNYTINKLPLHIIEELKIIRGILEKIKVKLSKHKKVIIVSDHGASRLVIINEKQYSFEVHSNGTQGGRCCLYTEDLPPVEYATIENGQYVLASYDRFKGGRAARVETHGGATLEEVIVPIIELTRTDDDIEVKFIETTITVSFKKKAVLRLFSTKKLGRALLKINSIFYKATEENETIYTIPIEDITKSGCYKADVYDGDNLIIEGLSFTIVKEGSFMKEIL